MAFPVSPVNGQIATVNGIIYSYASATNSWKKVTTSINNLTVTGNVTTGNVVTGIVAATGNITAANIIASGNIQGNYIIGNGSQLTNLNAASTGKAIAMAIVFGG